MGRHRGRLATVLVITAGIAVAEVCGALVSGSLVLLADAAHMAADAAGVGLSLLAAYVAARPTSDRWTFGYARAEGSLFVDGASSRDVDQGNVGDCYLMAGLGAVALQDPARIRNMFTDNGDGTFTVRFFRDGRAEYVTVDRYLPVDANGRLVFANDGQLASSPTNELWGALAEKAYAQLAESGWSRGAAKPNAYASISVGWEADVVIQLTGKQEAWVQMANNTTTFNALVSAATSGAAAHAFNAR